MEFEHEIKNEKLKKMVENKAKELKISVGELIYNYINRGLLYDGLNEENFERLHSKETLKEIDDALNID
ncbi:hypothetical protein [Methanobrevibacter sp.]|uniref:hypothetical protein n=1 Tax=Methanobrevibacter sp. TaxID=66852 RepID=UPI0026E08FF7|nr:hypothetical protein [Methanobrevibacter sp.]MDO5860790.1 hypothetical protein [Methanobrevibacter sp.]